MKKYLFALPLMAIMASCSGTHDPIDNVYTLSVDKTVIESDGKDVATFTIIDSYGNDITATDLRNTSFTIEETGEVYSGKGTGVVPNVFSSIVDGSYTVSAMYNGISCENKVSVKSQNRKNYEVFHKNVAVYRLTGTWCQYCPYMTTALNNVNDYTKDHSIVLEFHNGDEFSVSYDATRDLAAFILSRYGTANDGYPFCVYGAETGSGKRTVTDIQRFVKTQLYDHPARTGIKAVSAVNEKSVVVEANIKASASGKYDLCMAVVRDECVPTSAGAYEDKYHGVVRGITNNFYGLSTDAVNLEAGAESVKISKSFVSEEIAKYPSDMRIVLLTIAEEGGKAYVDNAVSFKIGESVDYRYNQ